MNDRDPNHLHPDLQPLCREWLFRCDKRHIQSFVTYTFRSPAEQDELYALGRTTPGHVVTNARGGKSKHNFTLDGKPASRAFDFAIKYPSGKLNWDVTSPEWKAAVATGKDLGLTWGGDWHSIQDFCHFQID